MTRISRALTLKLTRTRCWISQPPECSYPSQFFFYKEQMVPNYAWVAFSLIKS